MHHLPDESVESVEAGNPFGHGEVGIGRKCHCRAQRGVSPPLLVRVDRCVSPIGVAEKIQISRSAFRRVLVVDRHLYSPHSTAHPCRA